MRKVRITFTVLFVLALVLPPLGIFGVRGFTKVAGVEREVSKPHFTTENFFSGKFQNEAVGYYSRKMFLRGEMYKIKNGLYSIMNFGQYLSGAGRSLVQGSGGFVYEAPYLDVKYNPPTRYHDSGSRAEFTETLEKFKSLLEKRGVALGVILAPNKADACSDYVPFRYRLFDRNNGGFELYESRSGSLRDAEIPYVNGLNVCGGFDDPAMMFPYGGTHWTAFCAGVCASNLLAEMNLKLAGEYPEISVSSSGFGTERVMPTDVDLAFLKNLPWRTGDEWHKFYRFTTSSLKSVPKTVCIFGDSFSVQLDYVFRESHAFSKQLLIYNRLPERDYFNDCLDNCSAVILVYSSHSLARDRVCREIKYLCDLLR